MDFQRTAGDRGAVDRGDAARRLRSRNRAFATSGPTHVISHLQVEKNSARCPLLASIYSSASESERSESSEENITGSEEGCDIGWDVDDERPRNAGDSFLLCIR